MKKKLVGPSRVPRKTTPKTLTNLVILDASGSMSSEEKTIREGLRQLFTDIKKVGETDTSIKQVNIVTDFSSAGDFNVLINSNVTDDLTFEFADKYKTRNLTALYDAIGKSFNLVPEGEKNVFVVIYTDGYENNSTEYTGVAIKKLIKAKKKLGWVINFIGSDITVIQKAQKSIGITGLNYGTMGTNGADGLMGVNGVSGVSNIAQCMYFMSVSSNTALSDTLLEDAQTVYDQNSK